MRYPLSFGGRDELERRAVRANLQRQGANLHATSHQLRDRDTRNLELLTNVSSEGTAIDRLKHRINSPYPFLGLEHVQSELHVVARKAPELVIEAALAQKALVSTAEAFISATDHIERILETPDKRDLHELEQLAARVDAATYSLNQISKGDALRWMTTIELRLIRSAYAGFLRAQRGLAPILERLFDESSEKRSRAARLSDVAHSIIEAVRASISEHAPLFAPLTFDKPLPPGYVRPIERVPIGVRSAFETWLNHDHHRPYVGSEAFGMEATTEKFVETIDLTRRAWSKLAATRPPQTTPEAFALTAFKLAHHASNARTDPIPFADMLDAYTGLFIGLAATRREAEAERLFAECVDRAMKSNRPLLVEARGVAAEALLENEAPEVRKSLSRELTESELVVTAAGPGNFFELADRAVAAYRRIAEDAIKHASGVQHPRRRVRPLPEDIFGAALSTASARAGELPFDELIAAHSMVFLMRGDEDFGRQYFGDVLDSVIEEMKSAGVSAYDAIHRAMVKHVAWRHHFDIPAEVERTLAGDAFRKLSENPARSHFQRIELGLEAFTAIRHVLQGDKQTAAELLAQAIVLAPGRVGERLSLADLGRALAKIRSAGADRAVLDRAITVWKKGKQPFSDILSKVLEGKA